MERYIFGTCDALPLEDEYERLTAADTPFVSRDIKKRTDPKMSLPSAQSVIVLGRGYEQSPYKNMSSLGYCADYHPKLRNILTKLANSLNCNYTVMVDSGPLSERAFTVKAGLGFWGKNCMVISPLLGSFFNIGLLITDIALSPSVPKTSAFPSACPVDCEICIKSCPNNAIKPYSIDVKRCISYLTQKKEPLTEDEKPLIKNQLFGCDICQACCPFNKSDLPTQTLDIHGDKFIEDFKNTSAAWRGIEHIRRNNEIIMENRKRR